MGGCGVQEAGALDRRGASEAVIGVVSRVADEEEEGEEEEEDGWTRIEGRMSLFVGRSVGRACPLSSLPILILK
jgi:hypothetical protein